MAQAIPALLYSRFDDGHRPAFIDLFVALLPARRARAPELWLASSPVLFLMIEEAFALYALVALFRAAMGRRTVGFLFRPGPAVKGDSPRLRAKRAVLRLLRRIPHCTSLTIVPFFSEPRFAEIADGWIDDPQQWDLPDADLRQVENLRRAPGGLALQVRDAAGDRPVLAALGRLDRDKGFDQMVSAYLADEATRRGWMFAAGGTVAAALAATAQDFASAGGKLFNKHLSDGEMLELYAAADLVWCCYANDYDQSSGILGRAAQLGIPAIVRKGSLLQRICEGGGIEHIAFEPDAPQPLHPRPPRPRDGEAMRNRMRERSMSVLRIALAGKMATGK